MSLSIAGLVVCLLLLLLGNRLRAPLVFPMFAALPFGSTAIATVTALGGSSPQIYTVFAVAFLGVMLVRRHLLTDLRRLFMTDWTISIVMILLVYVVGTSFLLPRMFAGQTTAFVVSEGEVTEVMLAPNNGNITQVAYFALGCLCYLAAGLALMHRSGIRTFRLGFFGFVIINTVLGVIDLVSKLAGSGDVLAIIRTASYSMLTKAEEAGFWRIAGGFPEASAFAAAALAALAFCFGYWRVSKSTPMLVLMLVTLVLVLLSTSSTAYVACALISAPVAVALGLRGLAGRATREDLIVVAMIVACLVIAIAVAILNPRIIEQIGELFQSTLLDKATSQSGEQRGYWNSQSIASFFDTFGLGVGFGSSRASSWVVAVISQTGVIGAILMASLVFALLRPLRPRPGDDLAIAAFHSGVRACVLAGIVAASVSGAAADPGLLFFLGLAVCTACRREVLVRLPRSRPRGTLALHAPVVTLLPGPREA